MTVCIITVLSYYRNVWDERRFRVEYKVTYSHPSSPLAWVNKRQGVMDQDLFRNTLATNGLSAGKPNRARKPKRFVAFLAIIICAYLFYHFTRG